MEIEIEEYLKKYNYKYIRINNELSLKKIYELFINNKLEEPINSIEYLYYGVYYFLNDDIEKMIDNYVKSNNINSKLNLGHYYVKITNYNLALKYYLEAYNINKEKSILILSKTYKSLNEIGLMNKYLIEGMNMNLIDCMDEFCVYHIEKKNNVYLRDELKKVCDKNNYYCYEFLANVIQKFFFNPKLAIEYLEKALPHYKNKSIIYTHLGRINNSLNKYSKAKFYFKKAIDENENYYAYINYGNLLEKYKNYNGALYYYEKSIQNKITSNVCNLLINLYFNIYKDYPKVIYYYNLAIKNNLKVNYNKDFIDKIKDEIINEKLSQINYLFENY